MEDLIQLIFKTYGIIGLILVAPFAALKFMWSKLEKTEAALEAANERVNAVHAQRVEDAKQISEKLMVMVSEHAELTKETNIALDRVGEMLTVLQNDALTVRLRPQNKRLPSSGG